MLRRDKPIHEVTGPEMARSVSGGLLYGLLCFAVGAAILRAALWLLGIY